MYSDPVTYVPFNVPESCDLDPYKCAQVLLSYVASYHTRAQMSRPPASQNPHTSLTKIHTLPINTPQDVDNNPQVSYSTQRTPTEHTYVGCLSESTEAAL